jgi:predicted ATPase
MVQRFWLAGNKTAFLRAQELAAGIDNAAERFTILYGLWVGYLSRGEFAVGRETAEAFRREAQAAARIVETVVAGRILGLTCLWQGDFTQSQVNLVQALQLYDPELDREAKFRFGMDSGACSTAYLAHTNWQFGEVGRARALIDEAVARAAESGHAPTAAQVYQFKALLEVFRGDANGTLHAAETVVGLGREHGPAIALGWGTPCLRWAQARLGDRDTGVTELTKALATYADQYKLFVPLFQGLLAEMQAGQDAEEALARIDKALALASQTGEHWTDALLHRIRGEILLKRDSANTVPAEEAFLTAIAVAKQQKAKSFELRAAMSLARLWRDQGKLQQARELLAPVYGWFTEGFDTRDLLEAKALLQELAA